MGLIFRPEGERLRLVEAATSEPGRQAGRQKCLSFLEEADRDADLRPPSGASVEI
jgi:hypothetical protein